ncbi:methyltransferase family protein [Marinobacterium sedimentorum]|uniref:methyltransferase family protein n=1 Tax=Marinobacterium sedimentorum TaxID=2927804 RepID=UPI0020C69931|nr:hypothetical protein [Marinobacterium sedimentorum]MCP8689344.1 hypothetical protein [Marinobacterium sedimentorum]
MFGFLLQWPTLLTLIMFAILVVVYIRLAMCEEALVIREFGDEHRCYSAKKPAFIPQTAGAKGKGQRAKAMVKAVRISIAVIKQWRRRPMTEKDHKPGVHDAHLVKRHLPAPSSRKSGNGWALKL